MHPILFRIPLPHRPLFLWWVAAAVALIALAYVLIGVRRGDRSSAMFSGVIAVVAIVVGASFRTTSFEAEDLPIYSYGVMLGLSLVAGWYITLSICEKYGMPKETMANCYVVTAFAAFAGSRLLYIATNLDEFHSLKDVFALRNGGLVAYGGFLGGFLGSWGYLASQRINLLPWADAAVPSLASGLFITRIGCYLFGCDFGQRLPEGAPGWLKAAGTFPQWKDGGGSPAYSHHLKLYSGTPLADQITKAAASLPVHPTQLYESLTGLCLFALLYWKRKNQQFRGEIFFLFTFAYGTLRFLLEILRDDAERGSYGPSIAEHIYMPLMLFLLALGFTFGIAPSIENARARLLASVGSFAVPVGVYLALKPVSFGTVTEIQLSTSQWIAVITGLLCALFFAKAAAEAARNPAAAMALSTLGAGAHATPEAPEKKRKKADDELEVLAEDVDNHKASDDESNDGEEEPDPS